MSVFSSYKKIFLLGFIVVILVAIPFSVFIAQKRQQVVSKAAASTTLSFEPASTSIKVGDTLTLSIMLNPGTGASANQVSFIKFAIKFDQTKFTASTSCLTSTLTPIDAAQCDNTTGTASISLSIGADPTKAITTKTKIATLQLQATGTTSPTSPNITFDLANTQVLSIASSDQIDENVLLSTTIPATVTIANSSTTTTTTTNVPACTSFGVDRSTTGTVPYSITFTAAGNTSSGTISKVSFNFGDGSVQDLTTGNGIGTNSISNIQASHTYNTSGTYAAFAILTDNGGNLSTQQSSCSKTITVNSVGSAGGSTGGTLGRGGLLPIVTPVQPIATNTPVLMPTIPVLPPAVLPPTGPGEKILSVGILGIIFTIIGSALFIL